MPTFCKRPRLLFRMTALSQLPLASDHFTHCLISLFDVRTTLQTASEDTYRNKLHATNCLQKEDMLMGKRPPSVGDFREISMNPI